MELYIHIPFCRSKCRYCDFASWAGCEQQMPAYVEAMLQEAADQAKRLPNQVIDTVFIGGGTPSVLPAKLLKYLLNGISTFFQLSPQAEFTTEANPGTLTPAWLDTAVACGVNRLSLGMQAFQPALLHTLGRIHDYAQVQQAVRMAHTAGIDNISLDLMFGLPGQTLNMWQETITASLALKPKHLSCYGLIPEPGTPLFDTLENGALTLPDEELERTMYDESIQILSMHGYHQYEISNFAQPGFECRHNLGYWQQVPYLGLGASAASMLPISWQEASNAAAYWRTANPSSIGDYLHMIERHDVTMRQIEAISPADAAYETWMLGLRTNQGVAIDRFIAQHGTSAYLSYEPRLHKMAAQGLLETQDGFWRLTRRGMDIQNTILVELLDD